MSKIKFGVWFHGNDQESEGICYSGREPYIVDDKELAEQHKLNLIENVFEGDEDKFSICMIVVEDK